MSILYTNNAATTLFASITSGATSLTVSSGTGTLFPNPTSPDYFLLTLQGVSGTPTEIVKVTARSTDTFTIVRAQEGTTASAFTGGDKAELRITAGELTGLTNGSARGATGFLYENGQTVTESYTITSGKSAMSVGPITVNTGISVTIPSGSRWLIL